MRLHLLMALIAFFVSACASRENVDVSRSTAQEEQQREDHFTLLESPGSRFR